MSAQQGPIEKWTRFGHHFVEGRHRDGYAVCVECSTHENEGSILRQCPQSPAGKRIAELREKCEALEEQNAELRAHLFDPGGTPGGTDRIGKLQAEVQRLREAAHFAVDCSADGDDMKDAMERLAKAAAEGGK